MYVKYFKFFMYISESFSALIIFLIIDSVREYDVIFIMKYTFIKSYSAPFIAKYIIHGIIVIAIPNRKYSIVCIVSFIFLFIISPKHKKNMNPNQNPSKLYFISKVHPAVIPVSIICFFSILFGYVFLK